MFGHTENFQIVLSSSNQHHELFQTNPRGTQRCCDVESTSMTLIQHQHHTNIVCPVEREVKIIILLQRRATTSRNQHNEDASITYKKVFLFKFDEAGEADEI